MIHRYLVFLTLHKPQETRVDIYTNFDNLRIHEVEGVDYRIRWRIGQSGIAILSIHGGNIEPGTSQIADAIAGQEHTFYALEGIKCAGNSVLHIKSTLFDEPTALQVVCQAEIIISIHGCAEMQPVLHLGGLDIDLKQRIQALLGQQGFHVANATHPHFPGVDQANICNLCGRGMGVQMEISRGLRTQMFRDLTPQGREHPTEMFHRFTQAVRDAIAPFVAVYMGYEAEESTD